MDRFLVCLATTMVASPAFAQVTSRGEFVGTWSESFESFPNYMEGSGSTNSLDVMGGFAEFVGEDAAQREIYIYEPGVANWGLGSYGQAETQDGEKAMGLFSNLTPVAVTLTFDTAVTDFGGYFATPARNELLLEFFDTDGNSLGSDWISTTTNDMTWFGWSSDAPIGSIRFYSPDAPVMDALQASPVPEPATLAMLGFGALAYFRRRKRPVSA